jgi:hypothetical protein
LHPVGDIASVTNLVERLQWLNVAAFAVPTLILVWLDRRAGRRR